MRRTFFAILGLTLLLSHNALASQLWQATNSQDRANEQAISTGPSNLLKRNISVNRDVIFAMKPGGKAGISLPNGTALNAELEAIKGHALGGQSWLGWAGVGGKRGRIVMTSVNGFTFGAVTYDNQLYLIEPAQNSSGSVLYSATANGGSEFGFGDDGIIPPADQIAANEAPLGTTISTPAAVGSTGTIDVGIFYHSSMRDRWGLGLSARLQFLVQLYDTAMRDSQTDGTTDIRANLVHISEVTGTLTKSNGDTLDDLKDGVSNADGDFSGVAAIKAAKGIDIVTYIRRFKASTHVSCGTGFVLGTGGSHTIAASSSPFGFNTVSDDKDIDAAGSSFTLCSVFTLAHEIGHNMGNQHDIANDPDDGVFSFSHGHKVDGDFRTIMGTGSDTRLGFYSNPSLMKCTDPGGSGLGTTACGTAGSDVARSMREQGKNVGTFNAPKPRTVSSVLPVSRSIKSDATATAFGVMINPAGAGTATGCKLELPGATPGVFSYQTTTAANALTGTADTPIDIPAGGVQNFIFSIKPGAAYTGFVPSFSFDTFTGADLAIEFSCTNRQSAESIAKLNTLSFVAEAGAVMDVIALAASGTPGVVETGGATGAFAVSVSNIGAAGTVTASAVNSSAAVTATTTVCETVPATGACKASPTATLDRFLTASETATFAFFVTETAPIVADFAQKRIIAQFKQGTTLRGATSVAVRTAP